MNCKNSQAYMMKYFDKELNDIEDIQLKHHIKVCSKCSEEFNSLKEVFEYVEHAPEVEPPEDFELQVMNKINNEEKIYGEVYKSTAFVYHILLFVVCFIYLTLIGGIVWETIKEPTQLLQSLYYVVDYAKELVPAIISMARGVLVAIVGVMASVYKTYYSAYIILGILLLLIQSLFFRMVREDNGGAG